MKTIKLNSKTEIPELGFGTWLNKNKDKCINAVKIALETGYRHIDTAQIYDNEEFVGQAIQESNLPRHDIFLTTKIWNENMYWDDLVETFDQSLHKLRTDYVDLLLLHFPVTELRRPAWKRMEEVLSSGKTKAIGVSNYTIKHLEELLKENKVVPAVNQIEIHVFLQQPELVQYCDDHGIAVEAYSPLAHGFMGQNETLEKIAKKHSKTFAQVMIRWCLEKGFIPLPKATSKEHIQENFDVFDFKLDETDLREISTLERDLRTCWDPTHVA